MRKIILGAALVLGLGGGIAGCTSWWQAFQANPVAQIQTIEQDAQIVINGVELAWSVIEPFLPAAIVQPINTQFANAVAAINHNVQLLSQAVAADVAAKQAAPDFTTLIAAVSDAVQQVLSLLSQYQSQIPALADAGIPTLPDGSISLGRISGAPTSLAGLDDAVAAGARIKSKIKK